MHTRPADLLKEARASASLTQRDLGVRAGIPQSAVSAYESGRKEPTFAVLSRLANAAGFSLSLDLSPTRVAEPAPFAGPAGRKVQRRRAQLRVLLAERSFGHPEVFGSVARGDDRPDSDLDLVVDVPDNAGLFDLARMRREAEVLVGVPVDLVPRDGLKRAVSATIAADLVPL